MGAFFLSRPGYPGLRDGLDSLAMQGFGPPTVLTGSDFELRLYGKTAAAQDNLYRDGNGDFAFATGTLIYGGSTGAAALSRLLEDARRDAVDETLLYGQFCLGLSIAGRLRLQTDRQGIADLFQVDGGAAATNSFLAAVAALADPVLDRQAAYEYVFQGTVYGYETLVRDLTCLAPDQVLPWGELVENLQTPESPAFTGSFDQHLERIGEALRTQVRAIAQAFPAGADTALSGGYDSRLLWALLREAGVPTRLHVYGRPTDPDVEIAKAIAAGEGVAIDHVDKAAEPPLAPDAFAAQVAEAYLTFDGCPTDGIFTGPADLATRQSRTACGMVALNGGGGEVLRNFFQLADRPLSARDLIRVFYSRYDPAAGTVAFDEAAYLDRLEVKVRRVSGASDSQLTRRQVERLYPDFRLRFWMGRNHAINNRLGPALTPFAEPSLIGPAADIPLVFKDFGRFEAALIQAIDPRLAAYPSAYGHRLDRPQPLVSRLRDWLAMRRPPRVRALSFRLQHRSPETLPYGLERPHIDAVLPHGLQQVSELWKIDRLFAADQFARAATLEYFLSRSGTRLV